MMALPASDRYPIDSHVLPPHNQTSYVREEAMKNALQYISVDESQDLVDDEARRRVIVLFLKLGGSADGRISADSLKSALGVGQ